eukprot:gnl/TRDRNA2_/TRDRNA2_167017_c0_seq12.p1 gnl/TRDRNA2_/TRDRNA2_167017_c0~~gnl/TRDRNA2_/TRDRNA2_167017_c0_seq12.p1  ORF type:complete len:288 (+),score=33.25 gnl/TRDRNA2_/TRDRNA2_167017_c0_seq12:288-1151(+)
MGQVESDSINDQPPPGGTVLYIQEEGDMCIYPVPAFDHEKPPCIPNTIPDHQWKSFKEKVSGACKQMWSDRPLTMLYIVLVPVFFCAVVLPPLMRGEGVLGWLNEDEGGYDGRRLRGGGSGAGEKVNLPFLRMLPLVITVAVYFGLNYLKTKINNKKDEEIRKACAELQSAGGGQITVEYRTRYTGVCKPKGAQPTRFVVLGPAMAPVGTMPYAPEQMAMAAPMEGTSTLVTVMVPEGVNPGATLRIQVPGGQDADVVVPEGLVAGQSFQAQVPAQAPPVIQATVVG